MNDCTKLFHRHHQFALYISHLYFGIQFKSNLVYVKNNFMFLKWAITALFYIFRLFKTVLNTVDSKYILAMTGIKPRISGVGSDCSSI